MLTNVPSPRRVSTSTEVKDNEMGSLGERGSYSAGVERGQQEWLRALSKLSLGFPDAAFLFWL